MEQGREIVLVYRQDQAVEPVVLRYERDLPQGMRRERDETRRETAKTVCAACPNAAACGRMGKEDGAHE